ncbi:MAG: Calx-beta domain-containing protein, partial [Saccharofermentanales bacterium]
MLNDTSNFANWASSPPSNQWTPISTNEFRFKGTFDGNGHTISGLYISKPSESNKGLFMYTTGNIRNLTLTNCYVYASSYVGGITSYDISPGGTITNCSVSGVLTALSSYAGGIAGASSNSSIISKCINNASVTAGKAAGGITGVNNGTITDCYNTGNITGTIAEYSDAAGIAGHNNSSASIINCYNLGNISAVDAAGGIVSYNEGSISNCYSAAAISGTLAGGLVSESLGSISYSYWNSNLFSGAGYSGSATGCISKTTAEMQAVSFVTLLNTNKGVYSSWIAVSNDYPTFGNPIPSVTLSVNNSSIAEAAGVATVTATLSATTTETVTVTLGFTGTATGGGVDYTASSSTITIAAGSLTGTVTITAVQDALDEVDETVIVDITNVTNATESGTQQVTVTITDDDDMPSLSVNDPSVAEGDSGTTTLTFTVTLSAASGKTVTVDYATAEGTATAGTDYLSVSGTLTFSSGDTSKTVQVLVYGDTLTEGDETILLNLLTPVNATISDAQGVGTILDDDAPLVTLSVNNSSIAEAAGVARVTATLSATTTETVTVTLGFTGTATGGGVDYTASSSTITIAAGSLTGTATVTAVQDLMDEDDETVIIDIVSVTNAVESGTQQVTVTITDDDEMPSLSVNDPSVTEGDSGTTTLTFTVTLSAASGKTVTVNYATAEGTATAGTDYLSASGTLTFSPGETAKTVSVTVYGDTVREPDETVLLDLTNPANATISDAQGVGTITNDDPLPEISINDVSLAEGNSGTSTMTFTVSLDRMSAYTVTVDYTTTNNTATAGSDYVSTSGTLAFNPGETTKTIPVTINGDMNYEPDESFYMDLSGAVNANISDSRGIGTITNDDAAPLVTLSVNNSSIAEAAGVATVTATLSATTIETVTVTLGFTGTATGGGVDYTASSSTITIAAGSLTGTATVTAVQDLMDEDDETVIIDIV